MPCHSPYHHLTSDPLEVGLKPITVILPHTGSGKSSSILSKNFSNIMLVCGNLKEFDNQIKDFSKYF